MTNFPVNTLETAPEASRESMKALSSAFGFLPNIAATMSTSPVLIGGLVALFGKVHAGSFSEKEIQTVLLTDAVVNQADWAVAFHSFLGGESGLGEADVAAIRAGSVPADPRLAALSGLARALIERRGRLADDDKKAFLDAGFTPAHLLEVVTIIAASTITNYTSNVTQPPLEAKFAPYAWTGADV